MVIKRLFERLINIGKYENIKVGIQIEKEVKAADAETLKKAGWAIGKLAKTIVEAEVEKIKKEYNNEDEKTEE